MASERHRDVGGTVCAALFILLGAFALYDTTQMVDRDSYVFPRAIIGAMMALSIVVIFRTLVRPGGAAKEHRPGSTARRGALVAAMLAATLAMPYLGFLLSGLLVFAALVVIAMYDPWTRFRLIVYPLVSLAIVFGFYTLFKTVLLVPLPEGVLF